MNISNVSITKSLEVYQSNNNVLKREPVRKSKESRDFLTLSEVAKDYQTAMGAMKSVQDVRVDKVSKIRSAMSSRNYSVNAEEISEKILKSNHDFKA